jgi:hypothetical protein
MTKLVDFNHPSKGLKPPRFLGPAALYRLRNRFATGCDPPAYVTVDVTPAGPVPGRFVFLRVSAILASRHSRTRSVRLGCFREGDSKKLLCAREIRLV